MEQEDPPIVVIMSAPVEASVDKSAHATSATLQTFAAFVPRVAEL
jgi:hypothetical protein